MRGTLYVVADAADPQSPVFGSFTMSRPRQGAPRIVDETRALSWVIEEFGAEGMIEHRLSEQGRASVLAAVKAGKSVPGVEIPEPGRPVATFRQDADAKAEVVAMWQRGEPVLDTVLPLPEGAGQ
ncbi:hypothetical protein [Gordonia sp. FQ]|uniref:hypothetical protein n=1 Tax=Gordonia sp. FQ TaxID=3446634 RepID=UPI003F831025